MSGQPADRSWASRVLGATIAQPDRRSCGAACLVVARMLDDEGYADRVLSSGFSAEVLAVHRAATGVLGLGRRPQVPWWRGLGTPPWAVAGALHGLGVRSRVRPTGSRRTARRAAAEAVRSAVDHGHSVPWYVGSGWLPRHVVLVVGHRDGAWRVYEPSSGRVLAVDERALVANRLVLAGWRRSWAVVLPRQRRRRTVR